MLKNFLIIIILLFFSGAIFSSAETVDELKNKIGEKSSEIEKLEKEISNFQKTLEKISGEANSLKNAIKTLDLNKQKLATDIKLTENQVAVASLNIQKLELEIGDKKGKIKKTGGGLIESIRIINEFDAEGITEKILSNKKISDSWQEIDQLQNLQKNLNRHITELKKIKIELEESKDEEEREKLKLILLKEKLSDQKKIVEENTKEKNKILKETKNQEISYKKTLKEKLALKESFEREVREYESKIKYILDPNTLPAPGSRVFSWPLNNIYITQYFGKTVAAQKLYVSGSHNGVDLKASLGTPIKTMLGGVVLSAGDTDQTCPGASYGKWVLVKHGNGLSSLYGHLSLIKTSAGEYISTGQIVGYSGSTGYSTGPHLHISVFASDAVRIENRPSTSCKGRTYTMPVAPINAYLDPMMYLPK